MIAKKVPKQADIPDNFTRLGEYIAAAEEEGEKLDHFWIRNCDSGTGLEDLDLALAEIEAVRKMRPTVANQTYHLVVSFRPDDREKLSREDLADIAQAYAEGLGFGEHQYVAGTHVNTDNFHMHLAFNRVHPHTLKTHNPFRDFIDLARVSREMEQKYGLVIDRGMTDRHPDGKDKGLSPEAQDFERHTWQQSFQSYMQEHKTEILATITGNDNWQAVHQALSEYDVSLRLRGNGMVFTPLSGKQGMKASSLDRSCSKKALEGRLGPFEPPLKGLENEKSGERELPPAPPVPGSAQAPTAREKQPAPTGREIPAAPNGRKSQTAPSTGHSAPSPVGREAPSSPTGQDRNPEPKHRYEAKPLLAKHPATAQLWNRFLATKSPTRKRSTLLSRTAANWKLFLLGEAYKDPLAMVLILAHQELLATIFEEASPVKGPRPAPKIVAPALAAWREKGEWKPPHKEAAQGKERESGLSKVSPAVVHRAAAVATPEDQDLVVGRRSIPMLDDAGNTILPVRNEQDIIVGLRLISTDGRTLELGTPATPTRKKLSREIGDDGLSM
ncbi:TraI/MobA(P) family conjugative relaxase [Telmatospirillum sp. J64-1]|uniref:TraI/MobA(P) family conjugative relaxase n=1 Tax=Telmatospirillum sp. J64-1 TaxID=2502183 RepID=UPI00115E0384|nr:TraI/MobA(P) family conjugative relaxase [Telmatospirillum sp. J64-1]